MVIINNSVPLLFNYATKELSQDAFFCWLLEWSNEKYKYSELHNISKCLIKYIVGKDIIVNEIVIDKQLKFTDFNASINNDIIISFEDKIKSKIHGKQLEKYKKDLKRIYPKLKKIFVYLKTDLIMKEEREEVEKYGYKIIDIIKLKDILLPHPKNDIYQDYYTIFNHKNNSFLNFENINIKDWKRDEWYGFIYKLSNNLNYSSFGDFYRGDKFWFILEQINDFPIKNAHIRLEIESKKFVIRIKFHEENVEKRNIIRENKKRINDLFSDYKTINKKFGHGKTATLLEFIGFRKYNGGDCLLFQQTLGYIEEIRNRFLAGIDEINGHATSDTRIP